MKTWILYVTFKRDLEWLRLSLRSLRKYGSGFAGITVVVPTWDLDAFLPLEKEFGTETCPLFIRTFLEYPGKGFVHHLAMICYADVLCPSATHILHMDPDCLFKEPVTPEDYFVDEKPVLLVEPYDAILRQGHVGRYGWKAVTEMALQFECTHETMCRHPAVHHSWLYKKLREFIEARHQTPFLDFVLKQKNEFPQSFGEFNTLGALVMKHYQNRYHIIDRGDDKEMNDPKPKVEQFWSYRGTEESKAKINKILA